MFTYNGCKYKSIFHTKYPIWWNRKRSIYISPKGINPFTTYTVRFFTQPEDVGPAASSITYNPSIVERPEIKQDLSTCSIKSGSVPLRPKKPTKKGPTKKGPTKKGPTKKNKERKSKQRQRTLNRKQDRDNKYENLDELDDYDTYGFDDYDYDPDRFYYAESDYDDYSNLVHDPFLEYGDDDGSDYDDNNYYGNDYDD